MRLTVRVPELPEGVEIDQTRLSKALRWALADGWEPGSVWAVNNVPAIAQLEELIFQDGQGGLSELFEAVSKQLRLPSNADTLAFLAKGRAGRGPQVGQLGFDFEQQHPRLPAGGSHGEYKPGEFVPKEDKPAEQSYQDAFDKLLAWNYFVDSVRDTALNVRDGDERKTLPELKEILERLRSESADYESGVTSTVRDAPALKENVKGRVALVEKRLETLIAQKEADEQRKKAEPAALTPEERAKLQVKGWTDLIRNSRQLLADHMTGETPHTSGELERSAEYFASETRYYDGELMAAFNDPENALWVDRLGLGHDMNRLRRFTAVTKDKFSSEQHRTAHLQALENDPGWHELQEQVEHLSHRAAEVSMHYGWLAGQVETESEEREIEEKGRHLAEGIEKKVKKIKAQASRERNATAKFFKEQPQTGAGFTRQQKAYEPDLSMKVRWRWADLTGQVQGSGVSSPMSQEKWDAIQDKHPMPGLPPNFFYMGPTDTRNIMGEANYAARRFVDRVPEWLMSRIADNGGEYVFSAPPPYRLGFKTQAEYDEWIGKQGRKSIKENDPRHWDDVGGFYRHADKKAYSQVGESGQRGTVDLELHEFGHMVDYLFNGGQGSKKVGAISETPEFKSIWKNLHPWLDNYMTKDGDAAELFAEGFAVFSESEENRRRMLSKDVPEPMQRLGRFFERFLQEGSHEQVAKSLWVAFGKGCDHMNKGAERHARGRVTENGADLRWDDGHFDEEQEERHEHFPTLFLKSPR